jgi:hypothetical protein
MRLRSSSVRRGTLQKSVITPSKGSRCGTHGCLAVSRLSLIRTTREGVAAKHGAAWISDALLGATFEPCGHFDAQILPRPLLALIA